MRFKKGSKVEVLRKKEVPAGSWRCAEIICGNDHNYTVKYNMAAVGEPAVERVSMNSIRPCPPAVKVFENWFSGDVVEVLHGYSWKMAMVTKVLRGKHFMVRLVGYSNEFKVAKIDIRLRQSWINGIWILVGKGSGNYDDEKYNEWSSIIYNQTSGSRVKGRKAKIDSQEEKDYLGNQNNTNFQESCIVSPRTLKRAPAHCYFQPKVHEGLKKFRAIEKDSRCQRATPVDLSFPEKIDNYVYTRKFLGQKEISEMNERTRMSDSVRNSCMRTLEHDDDDDDTSSIGSCSVGINPWEWPSRISACPNEGAEDHSSDAESTCQMYCLVPNEEELAADIHRLELHAYRCTLEALHASGPLSWEQETLISNLRIYLHISTDEHLMELRNLISSTTSISTR